MLNIPPMTADTYWLIVGAVIGAGAAILGGIVGGYVQGWASDHFEKKRAADEERKRWIKTVLEWDANGRKESLRRATLQGADLRGVKLATDDVNTLAAADLSFSNLVEADLRWANLSGTNLSEAMYDDDTTWPQGFSPPSHGAIKVSVIIIAPTERR